MGERVIAGLACSDMLSLLGDVLDGELPPETMDRVRAHAAGCGDCDRFAGAYAALVQALRGPSDDRPLAHGEVEAIVGKASR